MRNPMPETLTLKMALSCMKNVCSENCLIDILMYESPESRPCRLQFWMRMKCKRQKKKGTETIKTTDEINRN